MSGWKSEVAIMVAMFCAPGAFRGQSTVQRPAITGITTVSVYASDMSKSQHFYGTFLGFPQIGGLKRNHRQHYGVNTVQSIEVEPLPQGETDDLAYIAFATSDAKGLRQYLLSRKVPVEGKVHASVGGAQSFWVKDPEGHRIQFVQLSKRHPVRSKEAIGDSGAKEQPISRHILHAGFIVHDRAAEDRFYQDILGFRNRWQGGMTDSKTDWVDMQVPDGTDWLEYMMHAATTPTPAESGVLNHFALAVSDIHQAADVLQQRGWRPSPRSKAQLGRDGKWQLNLYDPNGTRVELMELVPVRTPCCSAYTLKPPALQ
jgi:catechol 2,3-dioxygenase-like lactoylglutathione lyase family enzyme